MRNGAVSREMASFGTPNFEQVALIGFMLGASAGSNSRSFITKDDFKGFNFSNQGAPKTPNVNTKVINAAEVKAPNAIKSSEVTNRWNSYLGENTTNINPRTGQVDPNRIFSADGTKSVRFDNHEMNSMGTPKFHYHEETWTFDPVNNTMTVTNTLQRIK
ncbi:hypothetical protein Cpap_3073 [Ruminiclostridium papyrosolvens DSM 2782]|uniref:Uncharacterized protein n=1 Tax=Ruminiclostridium papyrosolvens DSM 2782 TaxID=588581 RepID=F1TAV7_9FIRM|nr:hypothetical protein [Ruminiclostridium papyrosolvens]EGD48650.1 hypothetical protein Cpap_3073 [Ruminiclostridium papyrosolvens DSM 2782]WES32593.1 hypothetical protein P0092_12565 [Ruminiclostridium papyrosolvens DSM 2782]